MRLKGYLTVEASYIFTVVTLVVVWLIRLNFYLHNNLLSDACKMMGGIRYYQAEQFYFKSESIRESEIANSPVFGESRSFIEEAKLDINQDVEEYYLEKKLGIDGKLSGTELDKIITAGDNAGLVRSGGRLIQVIGGIADED